MPTPPSPPPAPDQPPRATAFLGYFARHRTAANLVMLLMVVVGLATIPNMRSQFYPDVVVEDVTVTVAWPGAGAEDVDKGIVDVLMPQLLAVEGVAASGARAYEGRAAINLEFEPGWNMTRAAEDVQTAVTTAPKDGTKTSMDPATMPGRTMGRITRRSTAMRLAYRS